MLKLFNKNLLIKKFYLCNKTLYNSETKNSKIFNLNDTNEIPPLMGGGIIYLVKSNILFTYYENECDFNLTCHFSHMHLT